MSLEEMKANEKKLIRLHESEFETSSKQYEKQLSTLNDTIDTHLREKKANELVSILRCPLSICFSRLYHRILTHK